MELRLLNTVLFFLINLSIYIFILRIRITYYVRTSSILEAEYKLCVCFQLFMYCECPIIQKDKLIQKPLRMNRKIYLFEITFKTLYVQMFHSIVIHSKHREAKINLQLDQINLLTDCSCVFNISM